MKKRFLSILMAAAMVLSLLPASALAAEGDSSQIVRIQDTDIWYADATREFMTKESYWGDIIIEEPTGYAVDSSAQTVSISTPEALVWWAKQVNDGTSFSGYTVNITEDLDLSAHYWTPICTGEYTEVDGRWTVVDAYVLNDTTINGNGNTITGLATATGLRGPDQGSQPGDGSNCYYDAAFIGYSCCDITISDLTFEGAHMAISEPFDEVVNDYGSSMVAVVVGAQSGGSLTLSNVTVNDAKVLAMQKAAAFVGNLMGGSTLTVNQCAVTNSTFSAYFLVAPIAAYGASTQVTVNGIKLENNTIQMVDQTWAEYWVDEETGAQYYRDKEIPNDPYVLNASATAVFNDVTTTSETDEMVMVAEVDGYTYPTLGKAISAANAGDVVTLVDDCTVDSTITIDKDLTLDLNGYVVSNGMTADRPFQVTAAVSFIVDGTTAGSGMTIPDSNTKSYGFIKISAPATVTLNGGTYTGDTDNGAFVKAIHNDDVDASGCTMNMNDVTMTSNGCFFDTDTLTTDASTPTLQVTGGSYTSNGKAFGMDIVYQSPVTFTDVTVTAGTGPCIEVCGPAATFTDCTFTVTGTNSNDFGTTAVATSWDGTAVINGGTYSAPNGYGVYIYNSGGAINIEGGTVSGGTAAVMADSDISNPINSSKVTITGGNINGSIEIASGENSNASLTVTGGYFTSDPSEYCADGRTGLPGSYVVDGVTYGYMVGDELPVDVKVVEGAAKVTVPSASELGITEEQRIALDTAVAEISSAGLTEQGNTVAADDTTNLPTADNALTAFNEKKPSEATEATNVTVVVVPRLEVAVEAYNPTNQTMTLEIEAVYDIKATTNLNDMKEQGDVGVNNEDVNTVTLTKRAGTLDTTGTEVVISIPLPSGFVSSGDSVYIQHKGYEYTANVTSSGSGDGTTYTATFTNPHGFSEFTISTTSQAVAMVGGESYTDFQAAVDAAPNGGTITIPLTAILPTEGLSATISGSSNKSVTVKNETSNEVTVNINGNSQTLAGNGGTYSFTYTAPNGGSGTTRYTVTVSDSIVNGDITVSPGRASYNQTVTITVSPDEGHELAALVATDRNGSALTITPQGDNRYTFKMPRSAVTVEASFQLLAPWSSPYADVNTGDWFYGAVEYVVESGLMTGTSATTFEPDATLTRAMMATVLWAMEGGPVVNYAMAYTDVDSDDWFAEAVRWATSEGVVNGVGDNAYAPNDPLTREQMAVMLYAYAVYKGYDTTQGGMAIREFGDYEAVSDWAATAMDWAVNAGLLGGKPGNLLDPAGSATRAEIATILRNFCENIVK